MKRRKVWAKRVAWLVVLWAGSVMTLFAVASLIRAAMRSVGYQA